MKKIALPLIEDAFTQHFGGADAFALYEIADDDQTVLRQTIARAPAHDRGVFPSWLRAEGISVVLTGGMGFRARRMFESYEIAVVMGGTEGADPDEVVRAFLRGETSLETGGCEGGKLHRCQDHPHG